MNIKERAKRLKVDIPTVYLALKDSRTPLIAKIFAGITIVYALSPIDLIPDFIPVIGYLDDIVLLPLCIGLTLKFIPKDVYDICHTHAEDIWKCGKPKNWLYAIPIVCIWIFLIGLCIYHVLFLKKETKK